MRDLAPALFQTRYVSLVTSAAGVCCFPKSPGPGATSDSAGSRGTLRAACGVPKRWFCFFVWAWKSLGWCSFEGLPPSWAFEEVQPNLCPGFPGSGSAAEVVPHPFVAPSQNASRKQLGIYISSSKWLQFQAYPQLNAMQLKHKQSQHFGLALRSHQADVFAVWGHENSVQVRMTPLSRHLLGSSRG